MPGEDGESRGDAIADGETGGAMRHHPETLLGID